MCLISPPLLTHPPNSRLRVLKPPQQPRTTLRTIKQLKKKKAGRALHGHVAAHHAGAQLFGQQQRAQLSQVRLIYASIFYVWQESASFAAAVASIDVAAAESSVRLDNVPIGCRAPPSFPLTCIPNNDTHTMVVRLWPCMDIEYTPPPLPRSVSPITARGPHVCFIFVSALPLSIATNDACRPDMVCRGEVADSILGVAEATVCR